MKIALLHLDLSGGPEKQNITVLSHAINLAAEQGANWIITPEMALQGYFFSNMDKSAEPPVQPSESMQVLCQLAARHKITIFLGCAEKDAVTGKCYNSCLVLGPTGEVLGRHRKMHTHGVGAEAWVTTGNQLEPVNCQDIKAGILVCADSWFMENSQCLKEKGAEAIIILAAWPPTEEHGPGDCWERCSQTAGLPVWVCNQTGSHENLDLSEAESAVVVGGKTLFTYCSREPAILLFEWDLSKQCTLSRQFSVIAV
ncbi:carbon-nitrogen hydrolase family protein [Phosphitispora sp. TUW77]|uniref:carbon-nitrogen hydrolase family protein n=1 Tax=Phosphitispora sp. TUW77 TaxID=3152361 RepID=UPI003AB8B15F